MTIKDITEMAAHKNERDLNITLLHLMDAGELDRSTFLDYLEITQADVFDCLIEADPDVAFRG